MNSIRNSPLLQSVLSRRTMQLGVGRGLRFCSGPSNSDYSIGSNELPVQEALAQRLTPGSAFYDVGANVGFFSVIGARLVGPQGAVYAFEPVPRNAAFVELNARINGFCNISLQRRAVSSESGRAALTLAAYSGGAALVSTDRPPDATGVIDVDVVCIDDLVTNEGLRPPSVVKVDVEGAELDVMKGMARTIDKFKPVLLVEIDAASSPRLEEKYADCSAWFAARRYKVLRLSDSYPNGTWFVRHFVAEPD